MLWLQLVVAARLLPALTLVIWRLQFRAKFQKNPSLGSAVAMRIFCETLVSIGNTVFSTDTDLSKVKSKNIKLGIRSEFVELNDKKNKNCISVEIDRVDDFGNFQLVSARQGKSSIKAKVNRDISVPSGQAWMKFPEKRCCVYSNEVLV